MASSDGSAGAPPSATVEVPGTAAPVLVVGAPGLPEADFRSVPLLQFSLMESSLMRYAGGGL